MSSSALDIISAAASVVAACASVMALTTAYTAFRDTVSHRQVFKRTLSERSMGGWRFDADNKLPWATQVKTPVISMRHLIESNSSRELVVKKLDDRFETTWVNFLACISVHPESKHCFRFEPGMEMRDGTVPMRWEGPDFIGMLAVLGFASSENEPNSREPMPLPIQFHGPLGWIQVRSGLEGVAVAHYRARYTKQNTVPDEVYNFFKAEREISPNLEIHAWHNVKCLRGQSGQVLYIGGTSNTAKEEDIVGYIFERDDNLFQTVLSSEYAHAWGLPVDNVIGVRQTVATSSHHKAAYHCFGENWIPDELLYQIKDALLGFSPDGFYFTGEGRLTRDVRTFLGGVKGHWQNVKHFFDDSSPNNWKKTVVRGGITIHVGPILSNTITLLDSLIESDATSDPLEITLEDIQVLSQASMQLRTIIGHKTDLLWALIYSKNMLEALTSALKDMSVADVFDATGDSTSGQMRFPNFTGAAKFRIPHSCNESYEGDQILAAILQLSISQFWLWARWASDVDSYTFTCPHKIFML